VVTSAGSLPARFIIHAVSNGALPEDAGPEQSGEVVTTSWGQWIVPSRDLISELLASCFYQAESCYVQSLAVPLLGAGKAGFAREVCLDTMFRFLARHLLRGLTSVREVRIVLFD
jgi:O-acetyl-ADP-ribose deacetylase (regulator of RNase III)